MSILLLVIGATLSLYCLWQLHRWLRSAEAASAEGPRRLEKLVDELVATAEATVSMVDEKAETLTAAIERADLVLRRLEGAVATSPSERAKEEPAAEPPVAVREPVLAPAPKQAAEPDLPPAYAEVYRMADKGLGVTEIARRLNMTKGEVQLILGLRPSH